MKNYYAILNVSPAASFGMIKKAYRSLALEHHPDRVPELEKKQAEERFKEIVEAYYVLSNSTLRGEYDQQVAASPERPGPDPADIFGKDFNRTIYEDYLRHQWKNYSSATDTKFLLGLFIFPFFVTVFILVFGLGLASVGETLSDRGYGIFIWIMCGTMIFIIPLGAIIVFVRSFWE